MANILTVRARTDFSTNRELLDFAENIALLDPNENPFTLVTMKFKTKVSGNIKHSWLRDELIPETDTIDTTTATTTAGITINVDNIDRWTVGDIWRREASGEVVFVEAVATDVTVERDYGKTSGAYTGLAASLINEDVFTWLGNANEDGSPLPGLRSTKETQIDNYCQLQRTPFAIGELADAAAVRGEDDWPYQARKSAITHMRKIERQNLFGRPAAGDLSIYETAPTDPSAAGGLFHFLTGGTGFAGTGSDRLVSNADITQAEFLSYLEPLFRYGSKRRICFCGPILRSALDSWGISKLNTFTDTTKYGMDISTWLSSHGEIAFITHKMLEDQGGSDGAYAFFLDMDDISWITYNRFATRRRDLDPYLADGSIVKKAEWITAGCLELREPRKHGLIYGITSYSA